MRFGDKAADDLPPTRKIGWLFAQEQRAATITNRLRAEIPARAASKTREKTQPCERSARQSEVSEAAGLQPESVTPARLSAVVAG